MFLLDGRMGHTTYLMFFLTFANFIIISFNFLIDENPILKENLPYMWMFSIVFIILYVPISILIGRWHRNTQLSTEMTILIESNVILANMFKILIDSKMGKATEEEIKKFRKRMLDIENRKFK